MFEFKNNRDECQHEWELICVVDDSDPRFCAKCGTSADQIPNPDDFERKFGHHDSMVFDAPQEPHDFTTGDWTVEFWANKEKSKRCTAVELRGDLKEIELSVKLSNNPYYKGKSKKWARRRNKRLHRMLSKNQHEIRVPKNEWCYIAVQRVDIQTSAFSNGEKLND